MLAMERHLKGYSNSLEYAGWIGEYLGRREPEGGYAAGLEVQVAAAVIGLALDVESAIELYYELGAIAVEVWDVAEEWDGEAEVVAVLVKSLSEHLAKSEF